MAEKRVIELDVETNLEFTVTALKKAQREVAILSEKFGATSKEAIEAAKQAGILKDKIGDAKALTDSFNPDAKFKALTNSLTGVAGGFSVVTGALGAFGQQNEDVEKALLKVQSAMAIASGAQAVGESIDSFKQLGAVIKSTSVFQAAYNFIQTGSLAATAESTVLKVADAEATVAQGVATVATTTATTGAAVALKVLRAALISTGIGALIVGIGLLIANLDSIMNFFTGAAEANKKYGDATKKSTIELHKQIAANERASETLKTKNGHEYNMAKASGASTEALRKLALKHADEEIALEKASLATARNTLEKEKNTLANYKNLGVSDEVIAKQRELVTESRKNVQEEIKDLKDAYGNRKDVANANQVERKQEQTDAKKDAISSQKETNTKLAEAQKLANEKAAAELKTFNDNLTAYKDALEQERIGQLVSERDKEEAIVNAKYEKLYELADKAGESTKALQDKQGQEITALNIKHAKIEQDKKDELKKAAEEKAAEDKALFQELTLSEDELKLAKLQSEYEKEQLLYKDNAAMLLALKKKYEEDVLALETEASEKTTAQKRTVTEKQIEMTMAGLSIINDLFEMNAGKSEKDAKRAFKVNKAFNLATALTNTYLAVTAALANKKELFPGQRFIEAGLAGAAGAVQVAKISKTQFESSTTPDTTTPAPPSTPTMSAPNFNVVGNSGINQLASLQQQPLQAYVVSGQVTSQQSLDRNRKENATL